MKAKVYITLKPGLLDAQGKTVKSALVSLGFKGVNDVRMGKYVEIELNPSTRRERSRGTRSGFRPTGTPVGLHGAKASSAKRDVGRMCRKLLANPIIENYRIELER